MFRVVWSHTRVCDALDNKYESAAFAQNVLERLDHSCCTDLQHVVYFVNIFFPYIIFYYVSRKSVHPWQDGLHDISVYVSSKARQQEKVFCAVTQTIFFVFGMICLFGGWTIITYPLKQNWTPLNVKRKTWIFASGNFSNILLYSINTRLLRGKNMFCKNMSMGMA